MSAYDYPLYYEIAFSYQDVKRQVDFFERVARKFCRFRPERFLDIGCGPSPQLRELARRGYEAVGLDNSVAMLRYLRRRAREEGLVIETFRGDMRNFKLRRKCDFAFVLSGSIYANSNREFLDHLRSVAGCLNEGGIYLIENASLGLKPYHREEWKMRRGDVRVRAIFEATLLDAIEQMSEEELTLQVNDRGRRKTLTSVVKSKDFVPQELRSLVELSGCFKFLGFFKHLSLVPLRKVEKDNIVLMQQST